MKDSYFDRFSDCNLMTNKKSGNRPCYYCFEYEGLYWMIPISSKTEKYEKIFQQRKKKYRNYFGIKFGYVNGRRSAFLLQNLCPVTAEYVDQVYTINHGTDYVRVSKKMDAELQGAAKQIIRLYQKGIPSTLSDIDKIIASLIGNASL